MALIGACVWARNKKAQSYRQIDEVELQRRESDDMDVTDMNEDYEV